MTQGSCQKNVSFPLTRIRTSGQSGPGSALPFWTQQTCVLKNVPTRSITEESHPFVAPAIGGCVQLNSTVALVLNTLRCLLYELEVRHIASQEVADHVVR